MVEPKFTNKREFNTSVASFQALVNNALTTFNGSLQAQTRMQLVSSGNWLSEFNQAKQYVHYNGIIRERTKSIFKTKRALVKIFFQYSDSPGKVIFWITILDPTLGIQVRRAANESRLQELFNTTGAALFKLRPKEREFKITIGRPVNNLTSPLL